MALANILVDFVLHLDAHLGELVIQYGLFTYVILFLVVFIETGFVLTPFLPGDSLLFAAGALAALGLFQLPLVFLILWTAAFLGDTANYWIGYFLGQKLINHPRLPINQKHLVKTQAFYQKHGGKTIFLARFIPILRTFAPFVAGLGRMEYRRFVAFNASGGLIWVILFLLLGYFFGNIPFVKEHFSLVIVAIITLSLLPVISEVFKAKR